MTAQLPALRSGQHEVSDGAFRDFMRSWPTGVAVVAAAPDRQAAGCTVNAFISVALCPALVLVSLSRESRTLAAIRSHGRLGLSMLSWQQRRLAGHFANTQGDRFANVPYWMEQDVPLIHGAVAVAVCAVERVIPAADHFLVVGRALWHCRNGGCDPLVSFDGDYHSLRSG